MYSLGISRAATNWWLKSIRASREPSSPAPYALPPAAILSRIEDTKEDMANTSALQSFYGWFGCVQLQLDECKEEGGPNIL
jgi:hypothetical protein